MTILLLLKLRGIKAVNANAKIKYIRWTPN